MTGRDPSGRRHWLAAGALGAAMPFRTLAARDAPDSSGATVTFPGATAPVALSAALKERCSLRAFGAKLDGTTDDGPAVARAVAVARANNLPVYHPGGPCLMAGAEPEIDTAGVAFAGIGLGDFNYPYGRSGSQFWITDTARSPFRLGSGSAFDGLVFFWPNQLDREGAPQPYPPLFTGAPNTPAADITFRNCQVTNAFDFLTVTAPGSVAGNIFIANCRVFALRNCFTLTTVPDVLMLDNNLFSYSVYQTEVLHGAGGARTGEKFRLRDFVAEQGCWCLITGDGTPDKMSSRGGGGTVMATNNYVFGLRWGVRVQGGVCALLRLTSTHFDGVATVVQVDPGGTLIAVQLLGSLLYPYHAGGAQVALPAFAIRDPAPDQNGAPICQITVADCEVGFAQGPLFDITGINVAEVKIADCKLSRHAHTRIPGIYHALRIAAPNAKLTVANNDVIPASEFGSGLRIEAVKWASITGNTFDGCLTPVDLAAKHGRILLSANLSAGTHGPVSVAHAGGAHVLDAANAWDKPGPGSSP
jgi:hypothetical protein